MIGNDDPDVFSAGASLDVFIERVAAGRWSAVSAYLKRGQAALHALRFCRVPVVAAVHGLTICGGCEVMLHADQSWLLPASGSGCRNAGPALCPAGVA